MVYVHVPRLLMFSIVHMTRLQATLSSENTCSQLLCEVIHDLLHTTKLLTVVVE